MEGSPDYFTLLSLPVSLQVDPKALRQKYLALSRQFHPDYFVHQPPEEQEQALQSSALLNKAVKVLGNRDETIRYVLQLKGLLEEEEKYNLPQDFLMEMMDLNEAVEEAGDAAAIEAVQKQIQSIDQDIYQSVAPIVEGYEEAVTSEKELLQVKDYYFKKKYLQRLHGQLAQKL